MTISIEMLSNNSFGGKNKQDRSRKRRKKMRGRLHSMGSLGMHQVVMGERLRLELLGNSRGTSMMEKRKLEMQ